MRRIVLALGALTLSLPLTMSGCDDRRQQPTGEPAPVEQTGQPEGEGSRIDAAELERQQQAVMEETRSKLLEIEQKLNGISQQVESRPGLQGEIRQLRQDKLNIEKKLNALRAPGEAVQPRELPRELMNLQRELGQLEGKLSLLGSGACMGASAAEPSQPTQPLAPPPSGEAPTPVEPVPAEPTEPTPVEPTGPSGEVPPAGEPPMQEDSPNLIIPVPPTPVPEGEPGSQDEAPSPGLEPAPGAPSVPGF